MTQPLFQATQFTPFDSFTPGIEGPACDRYGNLYAVNYARQGTIGKVTPEGEGSVFIELPNGSIGNGIRFNHAGDMFIADYTNHNVLRVDMATRELSVYAHDPTMHQPNDIAIMANGIIFASDPNWSNDTGRIWRVRHDQKFEMIADGMGTTNGIEVSPDERILYVNESVQRRIWAFDLTETGEISNKRLFIEFETEGFDGMRCDIAGNLYAARYGRGTIAKISPAGEVLLEIALSGKNVSNITFGGEDGRTCYATIADKGCVDRFYVDLPGRLTPP